MHPAGTPRSTVVVITWQGREHLGACLDALGRQTRPHRVLVVDNASTDGTRELLLEHPTRPVVLRTATNLGYAGGLAVALPQVHTPFMAWLNDDAAPEPDWLEELERTLDEQPSTAAATATLITPTGSVQSSGVRLTAQGYGADRSQEGTDPPVEGSGTATPSSDVPEVFGLCGGATLLRTSVLRAIGGVPAGFFCYYEDTDTSWRLRLAGHDVVWAPRARALHQHGVSTKPGSPRFHRWNERNRLLMLLRCAPAEPAVRELLRFAAITALLPLRRLRGRVVPSAANFRVGLRLGVLVEVLGRLPAVLVERRRIGGRSRVPRQVVWQRWAGR
ncbi:glycosyltransferase family 2 protein [Actinoalloteichus hymeniacidonis]|uniref:Glycosyltransferase n=1 Tax=Actinoalloteichus hymeniacidonis TaxID=340345 RepID=A0AAC9HU12_9PSEU|nr:glycosyltransferase family 2 protein [Actinoalloteichus hymeniacidonis]AOS65463.1 putative glycosyltransferase [Actinoalloteichus hymeniacidonis]MBB5906450.1 hypothetical protein [Actinoalloteichus hymeniacidonis]